MPDRALNPQRTNQMPNWIQRLSAVQYALLAVALAVVSVVVGLMIGGP